LSWWAVTEHLKLFCESLIILTHGVNQEETSEQDDEQE